MLGRGGHSLSPRRKATSMRQSSLSEAASSGQEVSIFELEELMGKHSPVNRITLRLIGNLKPDGFELIDESLLEPENLKFA